MRRFAFALAVTSAAAAVVAAPAAARDQLSGPQEIAFLNAQRASNGIPGDLVENPAMTDACAKHMNYIAVNGGGLTHSEDSAKPGYTPEGAMAGSSSVLTSAGSAFTSTGVDQFETAPIHLMQMLSPWVTSSGASGGCLNTLAAQFGYFGATLRAFAAPTTFTYPGDGSIAVPAKESASEGPYIPGAFVGLANANNTSGPVTGPHLFFYNAGPAVSWRGAYADARGHFTAVSLTGPSGPVAVKSVDNDTTAPGLDPIGPYLSPGGILIPVSPLVPNQRYTATVTFQPDLDDVTNGTGAGPADGVPDLPAVTKTWSFSAGAVAPTTATPVTPTPVVPTGTPPPLPVKPVLTKLSLKSRSVSVKSTTTASLWVTVEQSVRKAHSHKRVWTLRRSQPLPTTANVVARVTLKKLGRGDYRVTILAGTATGSELLSHRVTLK
ncbi:MAG: hypothetical protein AAGC46_03720 [Solirubrobacteraceae bacterium]|nr:hypothetical protein [Patulibacter sp.]